MEPWVGVTVRLGIVVTRAGSVDPTWTTVQLAIAALARGHAVRVIEPWDFEVRADGRLFARAHAFDPPGPDTSALVAMLAAREARRCFVDVAALDVMLLRMAPLDSGVIAFSLRARQLGVEVVNDPTALLAVSHKGWLASLREAPTPPTLVTRSSGAANLFLQGEPLGVVVKPARGSGGRAITRVMPGDDEALEVAFQSAARVGDGYVVVQTYLPETEDGEKRLVWMDGNVLGGYLRRRKPGEFCHNLKQGGTPEPTVVTDLDRALVSKVSPALLEAGVRLAGIDLIGGWITDVNALNPGGTFHTDRLHGTRLAEAVVDGLDNAASTPSRAPSRTRNAWGLRVP